MTSDRTTKKTTRSTATVKIIAVMDRIIIEIIMASDRTVKVIMVLDKTAKTTMVGDRRAKVIVIVKRRTD